jgi:phospholipid/cholesterol/gamma-HCH transport system substrate-binding protein
MGRKATETLVGVFVLLGMIAVVFLALKAANLASFSTGPTYALTAKFDNIGGLKVRAPVKSAASLSAGSRVALDRRASRGC